MYKSSSYPKGILWFAGFAIVAALLVGLLSGCGPHIQENSQAIVTQDVTVNDIIGGTYQCTLVKDDVVSIGLIVFRGSDTFGVDAAQITHGTCHGELAVQHLAPLP